MVDVDMQLLLMVSLFLWSSGLCRAEGQHNNTGPQCEATDKADIVLLVVCSRSPASTFLDMKNFLRRIVSTFDIGPDKVQIGLVCYSTNPKTEWHLNTHKTKQSLLEAVADLQGHGGLVLTGHALDDILQNSFKPDVGMRADSQKIAVLITDGASQDDALPPSQDLKDAGIEIYAIGVNDATESELRSIASDPDEIHMYNVMDSMLLQDIVDDLIINLCNSTHSSISVRLVDGTSLCSGRLEVKSDQSNQWWSSVCEDDFDQQDAEVVCRELGCGAPSVHQGALYGEVEAPVWTKEFQCEGNESALLDCRRSGSVRKTCSPGKAVGLTCSEPVRLVGGASHCAGTLEVKQGDWRPVYGSDWTLKSADAVCRKLNCGSAVSTGMREESSPKSAWEIRSDCIMSGHALRQCITPGSSSSIIEVTCSVSVRLVDGTSLCSGRLEVKSDQSNQWWSSVCEDDFDQQDAEVVCRELGCGAPSVHQWALYGEVEAPMWTKEFQCGGNESALLDCRRSGSVRKTCSPGKAVGLTCSGPVRLVGGASRCAGTLEVKHGDWRPVYGSDWTLTSADVVCRKLLCGSAVSTGMREESLEISVWKIGSVCVRSGFALKECVKLGSSSSIIQITCSVSVRLVDGTSLCSGRLEVKSDQSNQWWSSVCEDDFDQQDAEVVCRELGCGAPSVHQWALYGEVEAPVWTKEFQCEGNESALLDCRRSGSVRKTCSPGKSVGLTCSEPVRLVGGACRCAGTLEVKQGDWRPVYGSDWTLKSADAVCRKLNCGSAVSTGMREAITLKSVWEISSGCTESGRALRECVTSGSSSSIIEITCSVSVRLVDGTSLCSGRLEVKSDQSNQWWSSVCEDDFDQQDAEVVCRELGCGAPSVHQGALYGEVEAPVWTKEFQCEGNESALLDCRRSGSVRKTCSPGKSVGLTCSEPVRLVGGASRCAGTLEVKHGEWRPVYGYWSLTSVAEVCRNLDCGSAVSIDWRQESSDRLVWDISYYCTPTGLSLRECVTSGSSSSIMEITCADHTVFKVRLVVLPLTLLFLITVTCVIHKTNRGQKPCPQENIELDHYDFGVGEVEGGPDEEEGAQSAV